MKTLLNILSLLLAAGFPSALFAQFAGANLPTAFDSGTMFIAFAIVTTLLTTFSDYSRCTRAMTLKTSGAVPHASVTSLCIARADERIAA
jgi:hypothetical protein